MATFNNLIFTMGYAKYQEDEKIAKEAIVIPDIGNDLSLFQKGLCWGGSPFRSNLTLNSIHGLSNRDRYLTGLFNLWILSRIKDKIKQSDSFIANITTIEGQYLSINSKQTIYFEDGIAPYLKPSKERNKLLRSIVRKVIYPYRILRHQLDWPSDSIIVSEPERLREEHKDMKLRAKLDVGVLKRLEEDGFVEHIISKRYEIEGDKIRILEYNEVPEDLEEGIAVKPHPRSKEFPENCEIIDPYSPIEMIIWSNRDKKIELLGGEGSCARRNAELLLKM